MTGKMILTTPTTGDGSQDQPDRKCEHYSTEKKTNINPSARPSRRRIEKVDKERISRKSNGDYRRLLRKSGGNNGKEG